MFAEFMSNYGMELIGAVLTAVLGTVGMLIRGLAKKWLDTREKQEVARTAVRFAEQVFRELHGPDKFQKALKTAAGMLKQEKIRFTEEELTVMIEAAVKEFNAQTKGKIYPIPYREV